MVKVGELHWDGGGEDAEAYQARWKSAAPARSEQLQDDARTIEVDGRTYTVRVNHPFPSLVITDGELATVVPTNGVTRWTDEKLQEVVRRIF